MKIQKYAEWKALQPEVKCKRCGGEGWYWYDDDVEPFDCILCGGDGVVINNKHTDYFKSVVDDIRRLCIWTHGDFFASVGPFVQQCRNTSNE